MLGIEKTRETDPSGNSDRPTAILCMAVLCQNVSGTTSHQRFMKVGDRVRIKESVTVYHHPAHKGQPFETQGLKGEVIAIVTEWQGRPVSANFPALVKFDQKFRSHFRESELEVLSEG